MKKNIQNVEKISYKLRLTLVIIINVKLEITRKKI